MQPIRVRRRGRLRWIHGATRAEHEPSRSHSSRRIRPASYFDLLDDDVESWLRRPSSLHPSAVLIQYNEIVDILAGPTFCDKCFGDEEKEWENQKDADPFQSAGTPVPAQDSEEVSMLSDRGEDISEKELLGFMDQLPPAQDLDSVLQLDLDQQTQLYERHTLYRIKACKLLQGIPFGLVHLADLAKKYPPKRLAKKGYFMCYEKDFTFGWFFHPDHSRLACLDDYQHLVLLNDGGCEYKDWDRYCFSYEDRRTHREYIKYYEKISNQLKRIEQDMDLFSTCHGKWLNMRDRAFRQAMKIATSFTNISVHLVRVAFNEFISSTDFKLHYLVGIDCVYLEIWKWVTNQQ